jgi:oligosaccharide translocation protein RFT1
MNGVTEAFVNAVGDADTLLRFNAWLTVCSAIYLTSAAVLLQWGIRGLIMANCLNMSMRIAFNSHFIMFVHDKKPAITRTHTQTVLDSMLQHMPSVSVWLAFGLALVANMISSVHIYEEFASAKHAVGHLSVGVLALVITLLVVFWREKRLLQDIRTAARGGESDERKKLN